MPKLYAHSYLKRSLQVAFLLGKRGQKERERASSAGSTLREEPDTGLDRTTLRS